MELPSSGLVVASFGRADDCYDIPPQSQTLCLVVASNGKEQSNLSTNFKFRYVSSFVSTRASDGTRRHQKSCSNLQNPIDLTSSGELLTKGVSESEINMVGGETIDTYSWIPQLGAVRSDWRT